MSYIQLYVLSGNCRLGFNVGIVLDFTMNKITPYLVQVGG